MANKTDAAPLPADGQVSFIFLTDAGVLQFTVLEILVSDKNDVAPLAKLYRAATELGLRKAGQKK